MRSRRLPAIAATLLIVLLAVLLWPARPVIGQRSATKASVPAEAPVPEVVGEVASPVIAPSTAGLPLAADVPPPAGFGQWVTEKQRQPDFAKIEAFDGWLEQWKAADPVARVAMAKEGAAFAAARRPEFKALIATNPQRALEEAVPRVIRQDLPEEILASLEKPVSATGDYNVYNGLPEPGTEMPPGGLAPLRYFEAAGMSLKARVFGEMLPVMSRKGIPLRGVAVDREFAVAESPLRALEVGERIPAGTIVENTCPVSGETTAAVATGEAVEESSPTVEVGERIITLCNGSHVTVLDEQYRTLVQASGAGGPSFFMDNFPGTSSRAIGNFRCLYIRATYPDQMAQPNTEDQAIGDMRNNSKYYLDSSYGKMTATSTVTPLIVLPQTLAWYIAKDSEVDGLGTMQTQARAEARKLGYDPSQYNCIIVRVSGGLRSGASWGGGDSVWLGWGGMDVINHECGHSLGRAHANFWETSDGTAYGNGANQEYGNSFDVMGGGGGFGAHYNTVSKRALGWLPDSYVHLPTTNGVFRLYAYDQPQLEEGKRYALSVAKDSIRGYNLEYHPAKVADQALVIYTGMGSNAGHLLDTTPGSAGGKSDGGIAVGRTYSDPEADIHFTVLSKNNTTPPSLDVAYFRGPFPGNQAPVVSLAASATTIAANGSVTFTATATDADGDALAYQWDFDDGVTAANAASVTRSFPTVAQITAMVTVSDMKGGIARRHVVINVGSHGKQTVTGNITWNGQPLQNVKVTSGSKYAYTDSSGNYALSGISTGSQAIAAALNGFTLTPSFTNPLTVVAGTNTANWVATNSAFVTLAKTADPVEGGASGGFTLTRTGDTAAAMVVKVIPAGGTATKTTDYTFSPDYATDANDTAYRFFTIPAGSASLAVTVAAVNDTAQEGPETITLQLVSNGNYLSNSINSMVMNVVDNDTSLPQVSVLATDPYAMESPADPGTFTFSRTGATTSALNLSVAWSGGATNGTDYSTLPATVTIPAGQASVLVTANPINDSTIEVPETIVGTINANAAYVRNSAATAATVILTDDDTPVVTVSVPDASASEAGPDAGMFLITRTGSTAAPLKVYYGLSGSAFHGTDYAPLTGETTIPAGATSAAVVITPYDDDLGEPVEDVTLAVTTFNDAYSLGQPFQGTLTIADNNDTPLVSVRAGTTGVEGGASGTVIFRAIGSGTGNVTVNYTVSGTATSGSDYTALSGSVSIPANGANDVTVNIPVINDAIAEPTETVKVKITPAANIRVYNDGTAEVAIRDNDSGERVAVSAYNSSASEAGTNGNFYIARAGTSGDLVVNYTMSGTATNGVDYTSLSGSATIPDLALGVNVTILPVNDSLAEGTEKVTMTIVAGSGYGVDRPGSATLEIADNDSLAQSVGFQTASFATSEVPGATGEYRDIPVVLSAASANTVTVDYVSGGGTATGDDVDWSYVDASAGNAIIPGGTLVFPPGTTTQNLRIRVKNDGVSEQSETAILELRAANQAGLTSGLNKLTVLIFDGAVPPLVTEERWNGGTVYTNQTWSSVTPNYTGFLTSFTTGIDVADNYSRRLTGQIVAPTTGQYTFWIASDDASRLYLSTTSSAANKVQIAGLTSFTDFQNWDANASQKSALISLVAGQSYYMEVQHQEGGGGDHASVAWSGPGFSRTPIAPSGLDVAPRFVRFVTSNSTRTENDGGEPLMMAVLDRPAGLTSVTVQFSVTGTSTAGSDYQLAPGTLTFAAGEQSKLLPLSILSDAISEAPEVIVATLTSASGAQIATPSTHTLTLLDAATPSVATQYVSCSSGLAAGTVIGTMSATPASGRSISSWSIASGNTGNLFAINASGQVSLSLPGSLPNPGAVQLVLRATDNLGATGDGVMNIVCNPPANKVVERRWTGDAAFWNEDWTGTAAFTGTLSTFTTSQNVADNYTRRLTGLLKPTVGGDYTFWLAGDDDSRLYLGTNGSSSSKVKIASLDGSTSFQAWDSQVSQKSVVIPLVAGNLYWLETQQREGGGGDHVSVAWSGPGISRVAIPSSVLFPFVAAADFAAPPALPSVAISSPLAAASFNAGENISISANVAGGAQAITSVDFYRGITLIGSDSSAPYSATWNGALSGTYAITARAIYSGGSVTSTAVEITVANSDPGADPDGDGFSTALEQAFGTDPQSAASQPPSLYSNLRAWWLLDEASGTNADDITGRPQDGTVSGAVWTTGIDGGSLAFDGVDDGVLVGPSAALVGNGDFTLSAWVKVDPGSPAGVVIQQREAGASGDKGEYLLTANANGTVNFLVANAANQFDITTTAAVNDGQWHHLAALRNQTSGRIFIDGLQAGSATGAIQSLASHAVAIGYDHRDNSKHLHGSIDDVRIYERALSASEVDEIHDTSVPNRSPQFITHPVVKSAATEDAAYSGSLAGNASDPDLGDILTFGKSYGPSWLSVAADGTLSGTPGNADVGANSFTITVADATGSVDFATLQISVINANDAPVFSVDPINGGSGTEDSAYSGSIAGLASDIDAGDTLTYSKASGPSWLAVAANGTLSGTPGNGDVGSNHFVIRATDGSGAFDEAALSIEVANVNDAPAFTADPITGTAGTEDTVYSGTLAGFGSDVDAGDSLTFSKISGPAWLTVSTTGELGGIPSNAETGVNAFVVRVTDLSGAFDEAALSINVANVNDAPVFTVDPILRANGSEETAYSAPSLAGTAVDADAGDSVVYSKVSGPAWLAVAPNGGLSGTPPAGSSGVNSFTVRATDGAGDFDDAVLLIEIDGGDLPLPWLAGGIGSGGLSGSATYESGVFTVAGSGTLAARNDSMNFAWQPLSGDGQITARVTSLEDTGLSSRVGVMIRDTLASNSRHVFMGLTGDGAFRWVRRTGFNGNTSTSSSGVAAMPNAWLRLVRSGNIITAYKSADGVAWIMVGSLAADFPATCYFGLAVSSGSEGTLNTSRFSNVTITP